jgi:hypothetical protein
MALGKELGTFDLRSTSITLVPGKKKAVRISMNFEGTVKGRLDGEVVATMKIDSPDGKDGKYEVSTRTFFEGGEIQDGSGSGQTTHTGDHKWLVAGVAEISNGRSYAITGEIDFTARTFVGKMYDRV